MYILFPDVLEHSKLSIREWLQRYDRGDRKDWMRVEDTNKFLC